MAGQDDEAKRVAVAQIRWKLRQLNFEMMQQHVVGRTLLTNLLQFIGGIVQNTAAALILRQECSCQCNFQYTVVAQLYFGLLTASIMMGCVFDEAIKYVSNRCLLVAINKTLEVVICVIFSVVLFVHLTLMAAYGDEDCASEDHIQEYFNLQLIFASSAITCMSLVLAERLAMRLICPHTPTHVWSLGTSVATPVPGDGGEDSGYVLNIYKQGLWGTPF